RERWHRIAMLASERRWAGRFRWMMGGSRMLLQAARLSVIDYSRAMVRDGLTVGTSGNVSAREGQHIAITPTGVAYDELTPDMITVIDMDGNRVDGSLKPSSEVPMHLLVYRETDARAVVHTHPLYATALGLIADETPLVHYTLAMCGGPVRVAPYATYGTPELAEKVRAAMAGRSAVLLRNHGATSWGASLNDAYTKSVYLEWTCRLWFVARSVGDPHLLNAMEFRDAADKIADYGRQDDC
ncbi:MAG: class II aldolase/adducin family protein, partial [Nakamurella sp.]